MSMIFIRRRSRNDVGILFSLVEDPPLSCFLRPAAFSGDGGTLAFYEVLCVPYYYIFLSLTKDSKSLFTNCSDDIDSGIALLFITL